MGYGHMLWSARDGLLQPGRLALPRAQMQPGWRGEVNREGLAVVFDNEQCCLGSAVVNGGLVRTRGFLNMHLREDAPLHPDGPADRLRREAEARDLPPSTVGMMTGASMRSMRLASAEVEGYRLTLMLTAGLANARRAGDRAEQRSLYSQPVRTGTINMALASAVALAPAAMAETLTTLAEARAAVLQTLHVTSPVSGETATGTGTDATAVFCPPHGEPVAYTGKHTLFGEVVAQLVIEALTDSLAPATQAAETAIEPGRVS